MSSRNIFRKRMSGFQKRLERQIELYEKIAQLETTGHSILFLKEDLLKETIEHFGPCLSQEKAKVDLTTIYRAAFHPESGSVIVANQGVVFLAQAPFSKKHFLLCHTGASVYHPMNGIELVNIGIVGDIYSGEVVLRSESACPPSFLFGSQRCNCCYQWMSVRELGAHLNPVSPPQMSDPEEFERWVERQFEVVGNKYIPKAKGPGVLMIHFDAQPGMGSGWTENEFCHDLFSRATLRQLGENRVEQCYHTTIKEGYSFLGLAPDGRKEGEGAGYQMTSIILDFLEASKKLICLSNNQQKLQFLTQRGYVCKRIKSLGQIVDAGFREAEQRRKDFAHQDIGEQLISFEEEVERLKTEICTLSA